MNRAHGALSHFITKDSTDNEKTVAFATRVPLMKSEKEILQYPGYLLKLGNGAYSPIQGRIYKKRRQGPSGASVPKTLMSRLLTERRSAALRRRHSPSCRAVAAAAAAAAAPTP